MTAVINAGPLMVLGKLNLIHLLPQLYVETLAPSAVFDEVVLQGIAHGFPDAYVAKYAFDKGLLKLIAFTESDLTDDVSVLSLGQGELQVIQLALDRGARLALLDDQLAREAARTFGLHVKGTMGVLVDAYRRQILSIDEMVFAFDVIKQRSDIWISAAFVETVWRQLFQENAESSS